MTVTINQEDITNAIIEYTNKYLVSKFHKDHVILEFEIETKIDGSEFPIFCTISTK